MSHALYGLQHTHISIHLMEGTDIYQIAKNCRTSVEIIENTMLPISKTVLMWP